MFTICQRNWILMFFVQQTLKNMGFVNLDFNPPLFGFDRFVERKQHLSSKQRTHQSETKVHEPFVYFVPNWQRKVLTLQFKCDYLSIHSLTFFHLQTNESK